VTQKQHTQNHVFSLDAGGGAGQTGVRRTDGQKFAPLRKAGFQARINENSHHGFTKHVERQDQGTISLRAAAKPWMRV